MGHISDALIEEGAALRARYHELASSDARPSELKEAEDAIRANAAAVSKSIAAGAKPCAKCNGPVAGLLKAPAEQRADGREIAAVYAVGCAGNCGLKSLGSTPEIAVERWNADQYFEKAQ